MADVDGARPWHAGPTVIADIQGLTSPAKAPRTLKFNAALTSRFRTQFDASFPNGESREQGCTIVADRNGVLSLVNFSGVGQQNDEFKPDLEIKQPGMGVVGVFHTHPYDAKSNNISGVSFSAATSLH